MEFLIVFIVSAFFLLLIGVAMSFGKSPSYRPDRHYVLKLMKGVEDRTTTDQAWDMLIGTQSTMTRSLKLFADSLLIYMKVIQVFQRRVRVLTAISMIVKVVSGYKR